MSDLPKPPKVPCGSCPYRHRHCSCVTSHWYESNAKYTDLTQYVRSDIVHQALDALIDARDTIRIFHGLGIPKTDEAGNWELYQNSPEMKRLNATIDRMEEWLPK